MKKEEMLQRIQSIGTCEDANEQRTLLAEFQTELEKDYDALVDAQTKNTEHEAKIDKLQKDNMTLFLKIGTPDVKNPVADPQKEKRKFEDLFNEKGVLK